MASFVAPTDNRERELYCMVYISQITSFGLINPNTLENIVKVSTKNNSINGITGVLCYGNGYFFQYIEGPEAALTQLKNQLLLDTRHQNMKIMHFGVVEQRQFQKWKLQSLVIEGGLISHSEVRSLIPFKPYNWRSDKDWQGFLALLKNYYSNNQGVDSPPVQYNALGMTVSKLVGEHQVFFLIQTILGAMMIAGVLAIIIEIR